jgi:hypothetical protein
MLVAMSKPLFAWDCLEARHRMAYIGYEPKRGTLKYRCPARH